MAQLRWIRLRWRIWSSSIRWSGGLRWRASPISSLVHFLHPLPLLWRNHIQSLWNEHVVRDRAPRKNVIARLNVCHRDAFTPTPQRSLFVQLQSLRDVICPQDRQLWRINTLYFTDYIIFAQGSLHHRLTSTAAPPCKSLRHSSDQHRCRTRCIFRVLIRADHHHIADFKIAELCWLAIFAKFRTAGQLDRSFGPVC